MELIVVPIISWIGMYDQYQVVCLKLPLLTLYKTFADNEHNIAMDY